MSEGTLSTVAVEEFVCRLGLLDADVSDAERLRQLAALESLKAAAAAAQARVAVAFDASQRAHQRATGVAAGKVGAGIAEQIALARRESPTRGSCHLGLARALTAELPHTMAALRRGDLSEWRATLVAQATAVLSPADRQEVDRRLAGRLAGLSDRHVRAAAQAVAYELDPRSVAERQAYAASQRRVAIRPAPDAMAYLTALLPVVQAVAVVKCLHETAGAARAAGDPRSSDQVKADTLVERVTGLASAAAVPIEVGVIMSDRSLFGVDHGVAVLEGYGPVPSSSIRRILVEGTQDATVGWAPGAPPSSASSALSTSSTSSTSSGDHTSAPSSPGGASHAGRAGPSKAVVWLRKFYADPESGVIISADRKRRLFDAHARRLVVARDQWCRTPFCGAPIRHIDHALGFARGGATSVDNAQGLCERCNHAKEAPGWVTTSDIDRAGRAVVTTTTMAGMRVTTSPPPWRPGWGLGWGLGWRPLDQRSAPPSISGDGASPLSASA